MEKILKLPSYENINKNKQWRNTKYWQRYWEVEILRHHWWSIIDKIISKSNLAISDKIEEQKHFLRN